MKKLITLYDNIQGKLSLLDGLPALFFA